MPYESDQWDQECPELSECEKYKILDFCVVQKEEKLKREILIHGPVLVACNI
jgi:hypothetical protein